MQTHRIISIGVLAALTVAARGVIAVNRCGTTYSNAASKCSLCPGSIDSECGPGETCYAGLASCSGPPAPAPPSGSVNRCGASYSAASSKCSLCTKGIDSECVAGEKCYAGLPACIDDRVSSGTPPQPGSISATCRAKAGVSAAEYVDPGKFVTYVEELLDLSKKFKADKGDNTDVNRLVLQYMRTLKYNGPEFQNIIDGANSDFVAYVDDSDTKRVAGYVDPKACTAVHADHWAVSTEGFLKHPALGPGEVNYADLLGWGGDYISFYGKWLHDGDAAAGWCPTHLFTPGTTFDLRDMIEDADAFNMGTVLRAGTSDIAALVRQNLLDGGYRNRFQRFGDGRFKTRQGGTDTVRAMLTSIPPGYFGIPKHLWHIRKMPLWDIYLGGVAFKEAGWEFWREKTISKDKAAAFVECFVAKLISIQP